MAGRDGRRAPAGDRAATEAALETAALSLLSHEGVLAGLNLQRVADEAGVNRGLVYHYFGSRRALLRAALARQVARRGREVTAARELPLRARMRAYVTTVVRHRSSVQIAALLTLDGDPAPWFMADTSETIARFARDRECGDLDPDFDDLPALNVAVVSLAYGYALFRPYFARALQTRVGDLDERFAEVADRFLLGLGPRGERTEP